MAPKNAIANSDMVMIETDSCLRLNRCRSISG